MAFPLTPAQQGAVTHRNSGLLVAAAAGSGKTRVLVERLLGRVSEEGEDITNFLVITYTKAAAAELRGRVAQELSDRLAERPNDRHLRRQATLVYRAQISTIHAFCSTVIRENGHLLDIPSDFRLMDEGETNVLMARVLGDLLDSQYEQMDEPFQALVDTLSAGRDDTKLEQIVLDIFGRIQSHPRPAQWLMEQQERWTMDGVTDIGDTVWGRAILAYAKVQVAEVVDILCKAISLAQLDNMLAVNFGATLNTSLRESEHLLAAFDDGWDAVVEGWAVTFPLAGRKKGVEDENLQAQVKQMRLQAKDQLARLAELFDGSSACNLQDMTTCAPVVTRLMGLVQAFSEAYSEEKRRKSVLDFSDLEHDAVALLVGEDGHPTALAKGWSSRLCEVMVDEYQDTNEVQNAIFDAVSDGGRKLFMVGDVKQSIYRFRLADPTIFLGKLARFPKKEDAEEGESCAVVLGQNFRSRPEVLEGCNDFFRDVMTRKFGELDYNEDHYLNRGATFPEGDGYAVELTALNLGFMGSAEREDKDLFEARWAARRIRTLLDEKFQMTEGGTTRNLTPSDVMVLMRSPNVVQHNYIRAFAEAGIPWSTAGGGDFFENTEIRVALSLLRVVDNPRQDVPLIATLRSPIYGFTGDQLAAIRGACKGDFYDALRATAEGGDALCQQVVDDITALRFGAGDRTPSQLIWHIYEGTNLLGLFGAMAGGENRRGNLLTLYTLAQSYANAGCRTLFDFLLRMDRLRETGGKIAPPATQSEGVSIMSVHRSKGLEKPVVILCGMSRFINKMDLRETVLFHPRMGVGPHGLDTDTMVQYPTIARQSVKLTLENELLGEELRLLYVAMTRAREKLIMCVPLTEGLRTLERLQEVATVPPNPSVLATQQTVGSWLLLHAMTRPEGRALRTLETTPIGAERAMAWDIRLEEGDVYQTPYSGAVEREERGDEGERAQAVALPDYSWRYPYADAVDLPSKMTATQLKQMRGAEHPQTKGERPLEQPNFMAQQRGLTPAERGTAIHTAVQFLPLDTPLDGVEGYLKGLVERGYLTERQGRAVEPRLLQAFLQSDLAERMRGATAVYTEFPFSILVPANDYDDTAPEGEEMLLQGVVDCWFEDDDGITIVDYKSDRVTDETVMARSEGYRTQLEAYQRALSAILGRTVAKTALWYLALGRAVDINLSDK